MVSLEVDDGVHTQAEQQQNVAVGSLRVLGSNKVAYCSNFPGKRIINAITGIPTSHRVSSADENLYFKVADATKKNYMGDADVYFYDSPDSYVKHRYSRIRYSSKSKKSSPTSEYYDKLRKDEMLQNTESQIVHWDLVDARGSPTDDHSKAYMVPRVNPLYMAKWTARRAARLSR